MGAFGLLLIPVFVILMVLWASFLARKIRPQAGSPGFFLLLISCFFGFVFTAMLGPTMHSLLPKTLESIGTVADILLYLLGTYLGVRLACLLFPVKK